MDRLTRDLGTIRAEIQDGTRTLEEAFARAEEKYGDNIETLLEILKDRYADILSGVAERSAERIDNLTEAYECQLELTQRMLNEAVAATRAADEIKELVTKIGQICSANHINPATSIISQRASDIAAMDIFKRNRTLSEIYEKRFLPFQEFFKSEALSTINTYITGTKIRKTNPVREPDVNVSNCNRWEEPTILECEYNRMISLHQSFFGCVPDAHNGNWSEWGMTHMSGGKRNRHGWWKLAHIWEAGARVNTELERRYKAAKSEYDAEVRRAAAAPFPSAVFDSLVTKVNGFLKQLI
jgi:hypothetical protein